jgi:flagellar basal body-associated protein FliL
VSHQKQKRVLGMTYAQIIILLGMGVILFVLAGCFALFFLFSISPATISETIPTTNIPLPSHTVEDFWDNGKGTNFAYFIVADNSLSKQAAETLIT